MVKMTKKKGTLTEEDVCDLLQKYSATQVLTLLREVSQCCSIKIDWNYLVTKTATGIDNVVEYQLLWRHLAYRQPLFHKNHIPSPSDDDSDLEYEVEASPPVTNEVTMEAANCVKVLAFGSPNESTMPNNATVKGDMPNGRSSLVSSEHPHPSSLHKSVQKQAQLAGVSGDANRRKRKLWSEEEDLQLANAVRKQGEVWAILAKGEFNGIRTAAQLSQRWLSLNQPPGSLHVGVCGSQLSEKQLATRHALAHALNNSSTAGCSTVGNGAAGANNPTNANSSNKDSPATNIIAPAQQQPAEVNNTSLKTGTVASISMPPPPLKKVHMKTSVTVDAIQATAVAAGARLVKLSDSQSLIKTAKENNTVHNFKGGSLMKSSSAGSKASLPPNVHFICTGLASTPPAVATGTSGYIAGNHQAKGTNVKPLVPTASSASQLSKAKTTPNKAIVSIVFNELQPKVVKNPVEVNVSGSNTKTSVKTQKPSTSLSRCLPKASSGGKQIVDAENSQCGGNKDLGVNEPRGEVSKDDNEKPNAGQECDKSSVKVSDSEVLPNSMVGEVIEKMDISKAVLAEAEKFDPMEL